MNGGSKGDVSGGYEKIMFHNHNFSFQQIMKIFLCNIVQNIFFYIIIDVTYYD